MQGSECPSGLNTNSIGYVRLAAKLAVHVPAYGLDSFSGKKFKILDFFVKL